MAQGNVPLPGGAALLDLTTFTNRPVPGSGQLYKALTDWVENKTAPTSLTLTSADGTRSQPICMHPLKATYNGSGDIKVAASYTCK
jgi:feruloyl esterase